MDPQLAALMSSTLKKQAEKSSATEVVVEASGDVQAGEKPKKKFKPPPGAQQLGMQAMLMQQAMGPGGVKLKKVEKK
eukprot:CAMPEP_0113605746 /NCGR_PEP_ID=MMETSP0017_2-20120614/2494_1 /TAXON_ID=2856 /ORGANISM="Cylindrotheca closterium" /LENGTH=76 /DNA_ID=CAMNT_0000514261 /DNA_START=87 /DNA_END=317 /DNA_ORIENTATION=+ /assembly_acc=CAM_ASM_000147